MKTRRTLGFLGAARFALALALAGCANRRTGEVEDQEYRNLPKAAALAGEQVVRVTARRFEYEPATIHLKRGRAARLEFKTLDCTHGFEAPRLGLTARIEPGAGAQLQFTPTEAGRFPFHCNVFCGDGHEEMEGEIVVEE